MADSGSLIKFALIGGAAYLAYNYFMTPAAASVATPVTVIPPVNLPASGPVTPAPVLTPPAPAPPVTPPPVAFNSLDSIFGRLSSAVGSTPYTADQFNFYLAQQLPSGVVPPDPLAVFNQANWDRNATMTLANYWGLVAPYLRSNMGLSGLGAIGNFPRWAAAQRRR